MQKETKPVRLSEWIPTTEDVPPLKEFVKVLIHYIDIENNRDRLEIDTGYRIDNTTFELFDESMGDTEPIKITYCNNKDMITLPEAYDSDDYDAVLVIGWMPLPEFALPEKTKFLNRIKGETTQICTGSELDKWKDPYSILNDIRSFESKNKSLTYPLWENDYLIVVPHKNKNKIGIFIEDGYGNKKGWDMTSYNASDAEIIDKLRRIVNIFYHNWREDPYA